MYDIIIIGAGPAGISAGIYAASRGKKTLIIEKNEVGGMIGKVSTVTHYLAIMENETGISFAKRMKQQVIDAGVKIVYENVTEVDLVGEIKSISTLNNVYQAPKIIIANGTTSRNLGIPGETELNGSGIGMNAANDGKKYQGKNIYVVGGADGAVKEAIYLSQFAKSITIIHFEDQLGCIVEFKNKVAKIDNINLRLGCRLHAVYGKNQVESLEIINQKDDNIELINDLGCGIFVYAGTLPNTELYLQLKLLNGYIPVNDKMETTIPGVYAAGDIRVKQVRQVATAISDGTIAAINASN